MKAALPAPFIVPKPDLLLEFLVVALDAPTQFGEIDQPTETDLFRQGREPVLGRSLFLLWPLDQQPFLRSVSGLPMTMADPDTHARKARGQPIGRTFRHLMLR